MWVRNVSQRPTDLFPLAVSHFHSLQLVCPPQSFSQSFLLVKEKQVALPPHSLEGCVRGGVRLPGGVATLPQPMCRMLGRGQGAV